jgi:hypothetical protein
MRWCGSVRPQMTIWRMRVACWIGESTRAHAQAPAHRHTHTHARKNKIHARTFPSTYTPSHTHTHRNMWYSFSTTIMVTWTRLSVVIRTNVHCTLYIVHWLSCLFCVDLFYSLLLSGIPGRVNVLFFVLERASCRGYQAVIQRQIKHSYFLFCLSWVRMSAATKPADLTIIDSIYLPSAERRCDMHCIRWRTAVIYMPVISQRL